MLDLFFVAIWPSRLVDDRFSGVQLKHASSSHLNQSADRSGDVGGLAVPYGIQQARREGLDQNLCCAHN